MLFIERLLCTGLLWAAIACACMGCASIEYQDKAGNTLKINRFAWQSKIGRISAESGGARLVVENYDSESQAIELAKAAVTLAGTVAGAK